MKLLMVKIEYVIQVETMNKLHKSIYNREFDANDVAHAWQIAKFNLFSISKIEWPQFNYLCVNFFLIILYLYTVSINSEE